MHGGMLQGDDLLQQVQRSADLSPSELVRQCGYVRTAKDGVE
jgi:hypothetical protein